MLGSLCFFVMMGQFLSASIPPMIVPIMKDLHVDSSKASQLASWATLAVGLGNIWAVPTVAYIGSRYTILIGLAIFTACFFWQGAAQSYDSLLAARVVGGLGGGVVEALGPVMVVLLFPREFISRAMSVYTWALGAGTVFGPLIAGYMIDNLGSWRYPNYLFGGISALNLIATVLMFPEPIMNIRVPGDPELSATPEGGSSALEVVDDTNTKAASEEDGRAEQHEMQPSLVVREGPDAPASLWRRRSFFWSVKHHHAVSSFVFLLVEPFTVLAVPAVIVTVLLFGVTIAITIGVSVLVSVTYAQPPFLWSSGDVGLFNISVLLGLLAGIPVGGFMADWLAARDLKRKGYFRPEAILPILLPFAITTPVATALVGVGLQRGWHWAIIGFLWAVINANLTGGSNVMISYSTESYPRKAIEIGVVVNIVKNAIGFGVSYSTVDWWYKDEYLMFVTLAIVLFAIFLGGVALWVWGSKITTKTKVWLRGFDAE
ncbi:major facilitator superfamily domain-containing protein [Dactylonectria macrodidyma]|uniref:Major facilitator superfamily domain-containing protein n=1 Tax=Dactylonectria macrodidyma TaxID=307937 RepID=A0A9P9D917_9HYPO|nr:major facilitator superfamily domain-containing protein [Dactylonectria macrodidyma]KAH7114906.1 major facilitator superfamily domain-containing protein [Dactylonectria macrodidyma]